MSRNSKRRQREAGKKKAKLMKGQLDERKNGRKSVKEHKSKEEKTLKNAINELANNEVAFFLVITGVLQVLPPCISFRSAPAISSIPVPSSFLRSFHHYLYGLLAKYKRIDFPFCKYHSAVRPRKAITRVKNLIKTIKVSWFCRWCRGW